MPEHQAVPFPPMTPLRGAVPGHPLTPVTTADAARLTLSAEAETSVLDLAGMRRLWLAALALVVNVAFVALWVIALVKLTTGEPLPPWWAPVMVVAVPLSAGATFFRDSLVRAVPGPGVLPRLGPKRWRWYRDLLREPVVVPPPAAWPPGSEAYAVLSGVASVDSVAPSWLAERVGLTPDVGDQWVAILHRHGWVAGGGRLLGVSRLPELHLRVTEVGRQVLDDERTRLEALAHE